MAETFPVCGVWIKPGGEGEQGDGEGLPGPGPHLRKQGFALESGMLLDVLLGFQQKTLLPLVQPAMFVSRARDAQGFDSI
jgi:hypothetical protein